MPVWPEIKGDDAKVMVALDHRRPGRKPWREFRKNTGTPLSCYPKRVVRINEVCALKIKDLDLKSGVWIVQRTYSGAKLLETTKARNKKPIPLSEKAWEIVRRHSAGKFGEDFLFINPVTGKGYRYEFLYKLWRKHAGVSVTFYEATRHSFCTQIGESGAIRLQAKAVDASFGREDARKSISTATLQNCGMWSLTGAG